MAVRRPLVLVLAALAAAGCGKRKPSRPPPVEVGGEVPAGTFHAANLSWQQETSAEVQPWVKADAYCRTLPLAGGGWRLPERDELRALAGLVAENPSLAPMEGLGGYSWSATRVTGNEASTWQVDALTGGQQQSFPSEPSKVRCVRALPGQEDGTSPRKPRRKPEPDIAANGQTFTAVDHEWRQVPPEDPMTFDEARRLCASLGSDRAPWRLPTWAEMMALYEQKERSPRLASLPGMFAVYWSADVTLCEDADAGDGQARACAITVVNFHDGTHYLKGPSATSHVRCVR